ncbi:hypothetical protein QAD02_012347 [Eretmocerus hayati]|uniref:Uncharacterized protein n=1 Tax=Eretmocerus hayati TaxID=131215 RepID=A0ACC2P460_9HYME|nr:hypothetical protein QAD02_012347 [Eretmocerus hayati]
MSSTQVRNLSLCVPLKSHRKLMPSILMTFDYYSQIEAILKVYKQLFRIPNLASARIVTTAKNGVTVQSFWSQKNLERQAKQTFLQEFTYTTDLHPMLETFPIDVSSELLRAYSEDENVRAVLRNVNVDGKSKQFIEIWDKNYLSKSYDLSAYDVHGDVYTEPTFSAFQLSPDRTRLLYVAEKKLPKSESFYKQKPAPKAKSDKTNEEEVSKGTEYIFKPDWGEQLVGKHQSVVVILNLEDDTINPVTTIPEEYFPAQVLWAPDGKDVIGVAYKPNKRYLGLYACSNRESYIFQLKEGQFQKLSGENLNCSSPRLSPDKKHLIWVERKISPAHRNVHRLMHLKLDRSGQPNIAVDGPAKYNVIQNDKKFYGLYDELPQRCWSSDSKYVFFSTTQRSTIKSYILNLESKALHEIDSADGSSLIILDVHEDYIASAKCSVIEPSQLLFGKFDAASSNIENIRWVHCSKVDNPLKAENLMYEVTELEHNTNEPVRDFNFIYCGKKGGPDKSVPLLVVTHGGPHASYCNQFIRRYSVFNLLGFGVLQINYRGSTGLGGDNVDYLLGKVGTVDVIDCVTAIDTALNKYPWLNPEKMSFFGGSHAGFLGAHLSGQYPDKFKAVMLLNPVIDMSSMFATTDIPDWCLAESGYPSIEKIPETYDRKDYGQILQKMLDHSPIVYVDKVKTPTLIALGSKDLRVPFSQGKMWYNRLNANNVKTKLFVYEDNHSLYKDEVAFDQDINNVLWMIEHNDIPSLPC